MEVFVTILHREIELQQNDVHWVQIHRGIPTPKQINSLLGNKCTVNSIMFRLILSTVPWCHCPVLHFITTQALLPQPHAIFHTGNCLCLQKKKNSSTFFLAVLGCHCCVQAFPTCSEQEVLFVLVHSFSLLLSTGSRCADFSNCSRQLGSHGVWLFFSFSLVVPRDVKSSQTRDWTHAPALAGGFLSIVPPGKLLFQVLNLLFK